MCIRMLKIITFHIKDNTTYSILCIILQIHLVSLQFLDYKIYLCYFLYFSNYRNFRCLLQNIFTDIFFSFTDMHVVFKFSFIVNLFIFPCSTRTQHCKWITGLSVKVSCSWHYSENMQDWKNFLIKGSSLFDKILDKEVH